MPGKKRKSLTTTESASVKSPRPNPEDKQSGTGGESSEKVQNRSDEVVRPAADVSKEKAPVMEASATKSAPVSLGLVGYSSDSE